jgi:hypothetical protein
VNGHKTVLRLEREDGSNAGSADLPLSH